MGEVEDEINPINGARMNRRKDVVKRRDDDRRLWFEPTMTEDVAADVLRAGDCDQGARPAARARRRRCASVDRAGQRRRAVRDHRATRTRPPTQQHRHRRARAAARSKATWGAAAGATVPAGAFAVTMNQPLARLAFYLLAPTSDDGLVNWNCARRPARRGREGVSDPAGRSKTRRGFAASRGSEGSLEELKVR